MLLLFSIAWLCPISAQDLPTLLSDFVSSTDRASRESILLEITEHHPEAGPALLKIARKTEDTETRWLAIRAIGWLKYKEAAPFLRECLHSSSNYVRANSASALGEVHDVSAVADLIRILSVDDDAGVLEQTSSALLMLDAKQAIPVLKARSNNSSPQTRVRLIGAIEALGSKDVPFFAAFLVDKDEFVAAYAAHAIERITKEDFGFPHCGETSGPCAFGYGVDNAQRWWNTHKQNWAQQQQLPRPLPDYYSEH
jgi:HEAT repeat protein